MDALNPIICAPATAPGKAAISVIRVSGRGCASLCDLIFRFGSIREASTDKEIGNHDERCENSSSIYREKPKIKRSLEALNAYQAAFGYIISPEDGSVIDQCVALRFKEPHSYTGEDSVELSLHGSPAAVKAVLRALYEIGCKPAEAGEFSRRAFINGKMDLTQAEAVMDLISSEAEESRKNAVKGLSGSLGNIFRSFSEKIYALVSKLEIGIEYPEYEDFELKEKDCPELLDKLLQDLKSLSDSYVPSRIIRDGMNVIFSGSPNVGKSSILNLLSGEDLAIVTDIPGTTRDKLETRIEIEGVPFNLVDTAGIRKSSDFIEKIGIDRSIEALKNADYVFFVMDFSLNESELIQNLSDLLDKISQKTPVTILANKNDKEGYEKKFSEFNKKFRESYYESFKVRNSLSIPFILSISALTGEGKTEIFSALKHAYLKYNPGKHSSASLSSERQLSIVKSAIKLIQKLKEEAEFLPLDILSQSLINLAELLSEVTGENVRESVLNEMFSRFCVGK